MDGTREQLYNFFMLEVRVWETSLGLVCGSQREQGPACGLGPGRGTTLPWLGPGRGRTLPWLGQLTVPTPHSSPPPLQVRRNLHLVLSFSPVGDAFRERLRKFPSLVNCTTIDWCGGGGMVIR